MAKANHRIKGKAKCLPIEELFGDNCSQRLQESELNWCPDGDTIVKGGRNFQKLGLVREEVG